MKPPLGVPLHRRRSSICNCRSAAWYAWLRRAIRRTTWCRPTVRACEGARVPCRDARSAPPSRGRATFGLHPLRRVGHRLRAERRHESRRGGVPRESPVRARRERRGATRTRGASRHPRRTADDRSRPVAVRSHGRSTVEHFLAPRRTVAFASIARRVVTQRRVVRAPHARSTGGGRATRPSRAPDARPAAGPRANRPPWGSPATEGGRLRRPRRRTRAGRCACAHAGGQDCASIALSTSARTSSSSASPSSARRRCVARALQEHVSPLIKISRDRCGALRGTRGTRESVSLADPSTSTVKSSVQSAWGPSARGHQRGGSSTVSIHASSFVPVASVEVRHASSNTSPPGRARWRGCARPRFRCGVERDLHASGHARLTRRCIARGHVDADRTGRCTRTGRQIPPGFNAGSNTGDCQ